MLVTRSFGHSSSGCESGTICPNILFSLTFLTWTYSPARVRILSLVFVFRLCRAFPVLPALNYQHGILHHLCFCFSCFPSIFYKLYLALLKMLTQLLLTILGIMHVIAPTDCITFPCHTFLKITMIQNWVAYLESQHWGGAFHQPKSKWT